MELATDSEPPRKRSRHGDDRDEHATRLDVTPLTRSPDFWFEDGTIILQAESTQFRVHRGMLARHSTIFRDMFNIPQPQHGELEIEGCLVVHVSDSSTDITHMLSSLYDKRRDEDIVTPSLAVVSAWLRLGKKYDIDYQYHNALKRLQSEYPATLRDWRNRKVGTHVEFAFHDGDLFAVVNLALETDTLSILPAAYLQLASRHITESIFAGFQPRNPGPLRSIPPSAQSACIIGRDRIQRDLWGKPYTWLHVSTAPWGPQVPSDQCCSLEACMNASHHCGAELWGSSLDLVPDLAFVATSQSLKLEGFDSFCKKCKDVAITQQAEGSLAMWKELPMYFGLPPWEELLR